MKISLCALMVALLLPAVADAVELEGRGVARVLGHIDSNVYRAALGPEASGGIATGGRLGLTIRDPAVEVGFDGGIALVILPGLDPPKLRAEWHGRSRITLGADTRFSIDISLVGGARHSPTNVHDEPEGSPVDLVELPRRRDVEPLGTLGVPFGPQWELRTALPLVLRVEPVEGLHIEAFGGARLRRLHSLEFDAVEITNQYEGGGGVQVAVDVRESAQFGFRAAVARSWVNPMLVGPSSHTRVGAVGLVRLEHTDKARLAVDVGWYAVRDEVNDQWWVSAKGIVGRIAADVRPTPGLHLQFGFGRDLTAPIGTPLPGVELTGWFAFDQMIADRVEPWADFRYSRLDRSFDSVDVKHAWTGGGGVRIRLVEALHIAVGVRVSVLNPSSTNIGEFVDNQVRMGVEVRDPSGDRFPEHW